MNEESGGEIAMEGPYVQVGSIEMLQKPAPRLRLGPSGPEYPR